MSAVIERIDLDDNGLDDLAISGELIEMLRLERMGPGHFWGRIYMKDGNHVEMTFWAKRSKLSVTAERDRS